MSQTPELPKVDPILSETPSSAVKVSTPTPLFESTHPPLSKPSPSAPAADVIEAPSPQRGPTPSPPSALEVPAYPAPLPEPSHACSAQSTTENTDHVVEQEDSGEEETKVEETQASLDSSAQAPSSNGVADMELEKSSVTVPPTHSEDTLESPIAQPEELSLRLPNGLPLPAAQIPHGSAVDMSERDDSPIAEPDVSQQPVTQSCATEVAEKQTVTATPAAVDQLASAPAVEEVPTKPVVLTKPSKSEVQDVVTEVVSEVEEDAPQLQTDTKEETQLPTETVPSADNTSETISTPPPPPTAEEKEEAPSPPTVTPSHVETTMQGQSLSEIGAVLLLLKALLNMSMS